MQRHEKINYVEFPSRDLTATQTFFTKCFGWEFTDYGPEYTAFAGAGLDGGFYKSDTVASADTGSALIVLYSDDLEATRDKIEPSGGKLVKPIFSFPGGRRFHFTEPSGTELAVWTEQ